MSMPSDGSVQRLHPLTLVMRFLRSIPAFAIAVVPMMVGVSSGQQQFQTIFTIVVSLLYGMVALPLIVAHYLRFRYMITQKEIIIRSGVFRRQKRNIPLERVQNVAIERSLLPRLMGLSSVKIMTAGSGEAEGVLEYTSDTEAREIRDIVRRRFEEDTPVSADPSVPDAPDTGQPLIAMPLRRLLMTGAFRFSLVYIAIIFSGLYYVQTLTGVSEMEVMEWFWSDQAEELATAARSAVWLVGLSLLIATLLFAWLTGMAVTLVRYFNFELRRLGDKLTRTHGLLTLQEATIPLKRIQALVVRSNPLMRACGWFRLELQTIGYDVSKRSSRMAIPLARMQEIADAGGHIKPFTLPEQYERVSPLIIRRTFLRYAVVLGILVLPIGYFLWSGAYWVLMALPLLGWLAWRQYCNHGYAFCGDMLYIRRGVLQQYLWIVPTERFQTFHVSGTIFQRRLGLRTVTVDTAGAGYLRYPHIVDLPRSVADALTEKLYAGLRQTIPRESR